MNKKMSNKKLNQVDSNYLYRFIRPKLKEIASINAELLLNKMEYRQKIKSIEEKIKKIVIRNIKNVKAIILYGSAIQTNYKDYKDIDILIVTKERITPLSQKYKRISKIKRLMKEQAIDTDIEIYDQELIEESSNHNPSLLYQLKDKKIIYGNLKLNKNREVYRMELKMKLDWSYVDDPKNGIEIYRAIRNTLLVRLLLNKIVDNNKLKEYLNKEVGENLIERLKNNQASKIDKKIALMFLKSLLEKAEKEVEGEPWEKIELSNH